jgi:predicted DNA-binding protein with PD1-like motif
MAALTKTLGTKIDRMIVVKLAEGDDIIKALAAAAKKESIKGGFFYGVGAAQDVTFTVCTEEKGIYRTISKKGFFEITSLFGNIATVMDKKGKPVDVFVHAHISVSDPEGHVHGGHLVEGGASVLTLAEVVIFEAEGTIARLKEELDARGYSPLQM